MEPSILVRVQTPEPLYLESRAQGSRHTAPQLLRKENRPEALWPGRFSRLRGDEQGYLDIAAFPQHVGQLVKQLSSFAKRAFAQT